mgnify:CR=1 FL=1|jgi:hypothetical protein
MNFLSKQDVKAPADHVFEQLADFDFYESYAMRLGAQVMRQDSFSQPQPGMSWNIKGHVRGKDRNVELTLDSYSPSETLSYICTSKSLNAIINFNVIPLSKTETRIKVMVDVQPKGLSARVAMQSARLAKKSLDKKFDARMHDFANKISEKYHG